MTQAKRIYIVGHPAAGKAYFGRHLAERLGYHFVDADMGLEHQIGLTFKEILGGAGLEQYGRTQERIFNALSERVAIVAGLECYIADTPAIRAHLKNACVIFLKTTLETQLRRCGSRHEPLVSERSYESVLAELHRDRNDFYGEVSDFTLEADDGEVDKHVDAVLGFFDEQGYSLVAPVGLSDRDLVFFRNNSDIPVRVTEQQGVCLKLLAKGLSAKEIARDMGISHRTVEVYIAQLKEKLHCDSSKELMTLYLEKN